MSPVASLIALLALVAALISVGIYHRAVHELMRRLALHHADTWSDLDGPRLSREAWEQILSWQSLSTRALFPPGDFAFLQRFIRYVVSRRYRSLRDSTTVRLAERTRSAFLISVASVTILFVLGCVARVAAWVA